MINKNRTVLFGFIFLICISVTAILLWKAACGTDHRFSGEKAERKILFDGDHIIADRDVSMDIDKTGVVIRGSGVYVLSGELTEGRIIIDAGDEDEIKLKLNGVRIGCSTGPPVRIMNAGKVVIRLKENSENVLEKDGPGTEQNGENTAFRDACIYARSDLNIKGNGSLVIKNDSGHGIFSTKDLKIKSGIIRAEAGKQAIHGKTGVIIEDGDLQLKAGTDGIHSNGFLEISGGTVKIHAVKYGMYAFTEVFVSDTAQVGIDGALSAVGCRGKVTFPVNQQGE